MLTFMIILILLLMIGAATLSASETSITAASRAKLYQMFKSGNKRAGLTRELTENLGLSLSAILLCNTLIITFTTSAVTDILTNFFGREGVIYAPLITSALLVVYAETLPKIIAVNQPERVLLFFIWPIWFIFKIFKPITLGINNFARWHLGFFGFKSKGNEEFAALEELRGAIDMHFSTSQGAGNERAMLKSILDLGSVHVEEIMVHRKNVTMIDADDSSSRIVEQVLASPFTRLPLWKDDPDNIIGIIHAKALLRAVQAHKGHLDDLDITSVVNKPWFIPENADLLDQLHAFRNRREHFAIVVDEYGAFMGIVTLEDILEEIVGDITDEHDIAVRGIRPQEDGSYIIDGTVTIRDINRQLDWTLPDEDASTIAGLLLYEVRMIPEIGQTFMVNNYKFEVLRRHRNQITLLRVRLLPES
ncbi:HlyC/CorC family transporter [Candidatus Paracaedibacter symbiosus]|uniref:HlyC/CorC family transporter n=1 Tax=Candidatus Paracaedibacter symbiosus TaxID=244582 RepID=UPI000509E687|nr:CNNM domain-containing protein [Candidatus Paracaedibacter symbiosus]